MQIHVVQRGETLWQISRRYGVDADEIASANELPNPNSLVVGQALVIPTTNRYVVQSGDTFWTIARRYGTTVQALIEANPNVDPARLSPGQVLNLPRRARPTIEVNAYLERMGAPGQQIVRSVGRHLTYLSPFSYRVQSDGDLTPLDDTAVLQAAIAQRAAPMMVITNFAEGTFSSELAHTILTNTDVQDRLITNVLEVMRRKQYRALNIDFEYVFEGDRERYNQFLRRVVARLRPAGLLVSTALAPKQSEAQTGRLYTAHDYPAHGEIVDFVIVMTYEWGWSGGPPMAVAPINQVRRVLDYAVSVIPSNKIMMGMPLYGYDWTLPYVRGAAWAPTISPQEAIRRALRFGAEIQYDTVAESPFFRYYDAQGREHVVWFEDARSVQAKFDTVKEYNLRGVSYWVLGNPFPQNWLLLEDNFRVRKLI